MCIPLIEQLHNLARLALSATAARSQTQSSPEIGHIHDFAA
jgi:hypothetical protein